MCRGPRTRTTTQPYNPTTTPQPHNPTTTSLWNQSIIMVSNKGEHASLPLTQRCWEVLPTSVGGLGLAREAGAAPLQLFIMFPLSHHHLHHRPPANRSWPFVKNPLGLRECRR